MIALALVVIVLSPLAAVGWLGATWSRFWLARPRQVRRALAALGLPAASAAGVSARRINKGCMNAVLLVTWSGDDGRPRRLVLKHLLPFGTLVGWVARRFGATPELPAAMGATARAARETRALLRLRRRGFPVPRCLAFSLRRRLIAMEYIEGAPLAGAIVRAPALAGELGRLLARMHAAGYSMGDPNPENMLVDRQGRIVPLDLEHSHFGAQLTLARRGFDLAWAGAFLAGDDERRRLFAAYGPLSAEVAAAVETARARIGRFAPLVAWYGRRWRGDAPGRVVTAHG